MCVSEWREKIEKYTKILTVFPGGKGQDSGIRVISALSLSFSAFFKIYTPSRSMYYLYV